MAYPLLSKLSLDDVLVKFKVYDRYHASASVLLILGVMIEYTWFCNYVFVAEKIGYRCNDSLIDPNIMNGRSNTKTTNNTPIMWSKNPVSCSNWVYDNPDSFVAEFQLANQDWKRTFVSSAHNFGYMFGLLIIGPCSDRFGRKTTAILTGVIGAVLGTAKSFMTSYFLYIVLEFLEAALGDPYSPLYTLGLEMAATKSRVICIAMCKTGLGIGGILLALIAWLNPYWRSLLRIIYVPGLLYLLYIYLLDESPRWLLTKGKKQAAIKIIQNAAKQNNIDLKVDLNLISEEQEVGLSFGTIMKGTIQSKPLLKRFLVCSTWWIACTFINFGLLFNSISLQGNKYINFGIAVGLKIPSTIITGFIITKFNRRGPLIFYYIACAALCIVQPFIPKNIHWLHVTNYMVGMLLSCMCFNVTYIFTSELFPTQTRNSMVALCSSIGRVGSIVASQTPLLLAYWSGLPTVLFGTISLIAGLVTLLVPDTSHQSLPDTVKQAEKMEAKVRRDRTGSTI